jgi:uncharacterized Fe-S cluster protein YjdI
VTAGSTPSEESPLGVDGAPRHVYAARGITVTWDKALCAHSAVCVRGLPTVFEPGRKPWVEPLNAAVGEIIEVIGRCPSGALQFEAP